MTMAASLPRTTSLMITVCVLALVAAAQGALRVQYFANEDLSGMPAFEGLHDNIDFKDCIEYDGASRCNVFAVRWSGYITAPVTGAVLLRLSVDDGGRMKLGHDEVISAWKLQARTPYVTSAFFVAGEPVYIQVDYFEHYGLSVCVLEWALDGSTYVTVPGSAFTEEEAAIVLSPRAAHFQTSATTAVHVALSSKPAGSVTVALTTESNALLTFSVCELHFDEFNWDVQQEVLVAVGPSFGEALSDVALSLSVVGTTDESYRGLVSTFTATQASLRSARCTAWGDPHFTSFDGTRFDYYGVGEFYLVRSHDSSVVVQSRQRPCGIYGASCAFSVAIKLGDSVLALHIDAVTGVPTIRVLSDGLADGVRITQSDRSYTFTYGAAEVRVVLGYWSAQRTHYLNLYVTAPGALFDSLSGLCGTFDGDASNDLEHLSLDAFGETQRVQSGENLFQWPDAHVPTINAASTDSDTGDYDISRVAAFQPCEAAHTGEGSSSAKDVTGGDVTAAILALSTALPPATAEETEPFVAPDDFVPSHTAGAAAEATAEMDAAWAAVAARADVAVCAGAGVDVAAHRLVFIAEVALSGDVEAAARDVTAVVLDECGVLAQRAAVEADVEAVGSEGGPHEVIELLQQCPGSCSLRGECTASGCVCDAGYGGADCSVEVQPAQVHFCSVADGQVVDAAHTPVVGCSGVGLAAQQPRCAWELSTGEVIEAAAVAHAEWSVQCVVPANAARGAGALRISVADQEPAAGERVLFESALVIGPVCGTAVCLHALPPPADACVHGNGFVSLRVGVYARDAQTIAVDLIDEPRDEFFGVAHILHEQAPTDAAVDWRYYDVAVPLQSGALGPARDATLLLGAVAASTAEPRYHSHSSDLDVARTAELLLPLSELSGARGDSALDCAASMSSAFECGAAAPACLRMVSVEQPITPELPSFAVEIEVHTQKNATLHCVLMQRNTWQAYGAVEVHVPAGHAGVVDAAVLMFAELASPVPDDMVLNVFVTPADGDWRQKVSGMRFFVETDEAACATPGTGCIDTSRLPRVLSAHGPAVQLTARVWLESDSDLVCGLQEVNEWAYFGGNRVRVRGVAAWQEVTMLVTYRDGATLPHDGSVIDCFITAPGATWREKSAGVKSPVEVVSADASVIVHLSERSTDCEAELTSFTFSVVSSSDEPTGRVELCGASDWITRVSDLVSYSTPRACAHTLQIVDGRVSFDCEPSAYFTGVFSFVVRGRVAAQASTAAAGPDASSLVHVGTAGMATCGAESTLLYMSEVECVQHQVEADGDNRDLALALSLLAECTGESLHGPCASPERGCITVYRAPAALPVQGEEEPLSIGVFSKYARELVVNVMHAGEDGWEWLGGARADVRGREGWDVHTIKPRMVRAAGPGGRILLDVWLVQPGGDWTQRNVTVTLPLARETVEMARAAAPDEMECAAGTCLEVAGLPDVLTPLASGSVVPVELRVSSASAVDVVCDFLVERDGAVRYLGGGRTTAAPSPTLEPVSIDVRLLDDLPSGAYFNCFITDVGGNWMQQKVGVSRDVWIRPSPSVEERGSESDLPRPLLRCSDPSRGCIDTQMVPTHVPGRGPFAAAVRVASSVERDLVVSLIRKEGAILFAQDRVRVYAADAWQDLTVELDYDGIPLEGMELNVYLAPVDGGFRDASSKNTLDVLVCP